MGYLRLSAAAVACLAFASTGCVQKDFNDVKAQGILGNGPIHLDAEQVTLTFAQVECGAQSDLWEPPATPGGLITATHSSSKLLPAGRELHFDDDVIVSDPGFRQPYVQVRGDFMAQLADGSSVHDDGEDGRLVDGKLSVIIPHSCFSDPLPVLGVRKGRFTQDANPVLRFRLGNNGWQFEKLVH